jgi:hypothetical protein
MHVLADLRARNKKFDACLGAITDNKTCWPLEIMLAKPMQRITRYPLILAVLLWHDGVFMAENLQEYGRDASGW